MGRRGTGTVEPLRTSIRLKFTHHGARQIETLDLPPTPANIRAARRIMERVQGAIQHGSYRRADHFEGSGAVATTQSFRDYAAEWLKTIVVAKSTRNSYEVALNASWNPAFGHQTLGEIRYSDIAKRIAERAKTVSGKSINNHL